MTILNKTMFYEHKYTFLSHHMLISSPNADFNQLFSTPLLHQFCSHQPVNILLSCNMLLTCLATSFLHFLKEERNLGGIDNVCALCLFLCLFMCRCIWKLSLRRCVECVASSCFFAEVLSPPACNHCCKLHSFIDCIKTLPLTKLFSVSR